MFEPPRTSSCYGNAPKFVYLSGVLTLNTHSSSGEFEATDSKLPIRGNTVVRHHAV